MLSLKRVSLHVCSTRSCQQQESIRKEIYNSYLSESYQKQGESLETRFTTEFNYPEVEVNASTKDANIELKKSTD